MKKYGFLLLVALLVSATGAYAQDDTALVDDAINAINNSDAAYFERALADDAVWLDEDGHAIAGKGGVTRFLGRLMGPDQKMVTRNVKVMMVGDAAWAYFNYAVEVGGQVAIEGLGSAVFTRVGGNWQIALIHGAHNVAGHD